MSLLDMIKKKQRSIVYKIMRERERQNDKWGPPESRPGAPWLAILGEEYGEVCRASLGNPDAGDLKKELIQVAAVAIAWIEALQSLPAASGNRRRREAGYPPTREPVGASCNREGRRKT
jgi:hypothetical protein